MDCPSENLFPLTNSNNTEIDKLRSGSSWSTDHSVLSNVVDPTEKFLGREGSRVLFFMFSDEES